MSEALPISPTDIAVLIILLLSALLAFARGLVREVLSIIGWVGAIFAGLWGYPLLTPTLTPYIKELMFAQWAAGGIIFLISLILLTFLTHALAAQVRGSSLSALDRSLGFVFGIVRGGVLLSLAYLFFGILWNSPQLPNWLVGARTLPFITMGAEWLRGLMPQDEASALKEQSQALQDKAKAAQEAREALERLANPMPTPANSPEKTSPNSAPTPNGSTGGYSPQERDGLDALLQDKTEAGKASPSP
jgi:membrane protein required for colicin V production